MYIFNIKKLENNIWVFLNVLKTFALHFVHHGIHLKMNHAFTPNNQRKNWEHKNQDETKENSSGEKWTISW